MITVLIADDHVVVRQGTRVLLEDAPDIEVVGEAGDGREAVAKAMELKPDVVLMDLSMPQMDGVEAIRALAKESPETKVLLLTGSGVEDRIFEALEAGALGYLSKTAQREDILDAVRRVDAGDPPLPPEITRRLLNRLSGSEEHPELVDPLTEREEEVLALVARGMSNREIAEQLHVSETTVRTHVSHILGKVGVKNRVQAALFALRTGIATLDDDKARDNPA